MREIIYKISERLMAWSSKHMSGVNPIHVAAVIIGLLCGIGAGLLKNGIDAVTHLVFSSLDVKDFNFWFFILPIVGIFLATAFTVFLIRHPMDHASERIVAGMKNGQNNISPRLIYGPIIGCALTLGLGGSAGAEDPIVYTGGAIGSNVGKAFKMPKETLGNLVGCGAAAAIAAIFMAPIGGVMFALEILKMRQSLQTILAIVLSSLIASLTCYIMLGCHTDITFVPEMNFDLRLIPYVILCGILCGFYSKYYSVTMAWCRKNLARISNRWLKALIGSVTLALLLVLFPSLYGEGYDTVRNLMVDDPISIVDYSPLYKLGLDFTVLMILMVVLLIVKPVATSATNDSGGIGGDFTPTFFCGGVMGFLFAVVLNHIFGLHLPLAIFAFFGMAAVMSGAVKAPLMAIFIASEMTGLYGFILPLTIAAMASFLTLLAIDKTGTKLAGPATEPTVDVNAESASETDSK